MDLVIPVTVKGETMQRDVAHLGRRDLDAGAIPAVVQLRAHTQPVAVLVWPIRSTIVSNVRSARPRQFVVM